MNWLRELARRLNMLLHRRQFDADLEEEMRLHLELRQQQNLQSGMTSDDAGAAARRCFGNSLALREKSHIAWGWEWLEDLLQDTNYGVRAMLRSPGITLIALLSLALGIGANTAIFSLMDRVMLRALPVQAPEQLVLFGDGLDEGVSDGFPNTELYSYPFYREIQKRNQVFADVAAAFSILNEAHGFLQGRSESELFHVQLVSGSYFSMLGVQPVIGRLLTEEDDSSQGNHPVVVVSYAWWTRALGRDPAVLEKKITLGSAVLSIVGVAPPEFFGTKVGALPDLWVPLSMQNAVPPGYGDRNDQMSECLHLMARLKPDVTSAQATANANLLFQQILRGFSAAPLTRENLLKLDKTHLELTPMVTGFSQLRYRFSGSLKVLMAVVSLVLLIACANIANLLLARSTARARELAVRQALGAARSRLIRQLLTESLVLAAVGGALGIAFASAAGHLIVNILSDGRTALHLDVSLNSSLLLFTLAITVATALLFGTFPAFRATRLNVSDSLKDGRNQAAGAAKGPFAKALIVSQVAVSLVLLIGAGLFIRSLMNLVNVDTGFNRENVIRVRVDASSAGYKEDARLMALYHQIEDRVNALPGVRAASFSIFTFNEGTWNNPIWVQGYERGHREIDVNHNAVGSDYFRAMGIPLLAGRAFGPQDTDTSQKVGIISETTARTLFPAGSPIGKHYGRAREHAGDIEVIGVVKDVKYNSLDEKPEPGDYLPYSQNVRYLNEFEVRYEGDAAPIISAVRQTIREIDSTLPIGEITTLNQQVERSISNQRLLAQLSAFFGLLAVFLSCIGIYGLMSYLVTRRIGEIGVRMALGANRSGVLWMVLRESLLLVLTGVAIGIPVAFACDRWVSSLLFGLHAADAFSFCAAVSLLLTVAGFAGFLPARRASLVEPMIALRYE
ncbi:MAG TPA: ABC transporter permease [Candidatus Methylomirabilis sp.]|nr:ABC transporter permease [Candidatus Methylomirabilis sp.]